MESFFPGILEIDTKLKLFIQTLDANPEIIDFYDFNQKKFIWSIIINKNMDFYNAISKGYDGLYMEEQNIKLNIIKQNIKIKKSDFLLDVGCGTGLSSVFNCKVIGVDPSIELLQQNNNNNKKILAKAENIPFKSNSFDKVISVTSLHNFDNFKKGLKEIKRVGKKDFVFSVLKKSKKFNAIEKEIKENFDIKKIIDGKKDWIFICKGNFRKI
tara:strand:+ start:251 stop:889 length:639 start_codon:yes stop_codon:yes gene_type:complete